MKRRFLGHYVDLSCLILGVLEAFVVAAGCYAACVSLVGNPFTSAHVMSTSSYAVALPFGIVILMHCGGLYNEDAIRSTRVTLWRIATIAPPIFVLVFWTTAELAGHSSSPTHSYRLQSPLTVTAAWFFMVMSLRSVTALIYRTEVFMHCIAVVGTEKHASQISHLASVTSQRFRIVSQISPDRIDSIADQPATLVPGSPAHFSEIVVVEDIGPLGRSSLARFESPHVRVTNYPDFHEREFQSVVIEDIRENFVALSSWLQRAESKQRLRRLVDVICSCAMAVALAPVLLLTAFAIKLEDLGPVLYRQERVGLGGRPFILLKFRSMDEGAEFDGTPVCAAECDPRISRVGRIIRKLRIDELPQLWNILRGDMSLIGPRPERPYFVNKYSQLIPSYGCRHAVRPGITGWAQVRFRYGTSVEDAKRKLSYDLYYVKNRSVFLDMVIVARTFRVVLRGEGAR